MDEDVIIVSLVFASDNNICKGIMYYGRHTDIYLANETGTDREVVDQQNRGIEFILHFAGSLAL